MLIEESGLPTIPHIYAVNQFHITRYQQWLKQNPHIQLVAINCQMQRSMEDIEQVVRTANAMLVANDKLHIILQGYRFSEVYRFDGFSDRIHIADSKPVKYGQAFRSVDPTVIIRTERHPKDTYKGLVLDNVEYRRLELQQLLV